MKLLTRLLGITIFLTLADYLFFLWEKSLRIGEKIGRKHIDYIAGCETSYFNPSTEGTEITLINFVFLFLNFIAFAFIFKKDKLSILLFFQTVLFAYFFGFLFYYLSCFLNDYYCNTSYTELYNPFEMFLVYFIVIIQSLNYSIKYFLIYFIHIFMCVFFIKGKYLSFLKKSTI